MRQLHKLADLGGYHLHARDGEIGKLKQIYFDDKCWVVRYFVVHTGSWLLGNDVLIIPSVVTAVDKENKRLEVDLTQEQIRNCPPINTALPVSLHYEQEYYRYYGWEPYWTDDLMFTPTPAMLTPAIPPPPLDEKPELPKEPAHPHLRSSDEVEAYQLHARDGEIGHVEDFILEDPGWAIRYLEIDTRNWLPGKHVLISPTWIQLVDWAENEVKVNLTCEAIRTAPAYDPSKVISREYQVALYKHYGMKFEKD
ncbi:MAG: PRC-barrel domain-containing protein [Pseudomonadales bacterium]|nr:PRC-barrel domain-containing protein [Pseudomonadales bacterium]